MRSRGTTRGGVRRGGTPCANRHTRLIRAVLLAVLTALPLASADAQTKRVRPVEEGPEQYPEHPHRDDAFYFCTACHSFKVVAAQSMSRDRWDESLTWMVKRHSMPEVQGEDRRKILVSGSHAGLLGGSADDGVLGVDAFAAFFNDAGGGKDEAGFARLPTLDSRDIAGATVSAYSARIGDGRSTYDTGVLSRVNEVARRLELREGMSAREAVARLVGLG